MKKNLGILSSLVGLIGFVLLILSYVVGYPNILGITGITLIVLCIIGGVVDSRINKAPKRFKPDEDRLDTLLRRGQFPTSWHTRGWPK